MLTLPQLGTMNELAICTNVVPFADLTYRDLRKLHNDSNTFQLERSGLAHILDCETIYSVPNSGFLTTMLAKLVFPAQWIGKCEQSALPQHTPINTLL